MRIQLIPGARMLWIVARKLIAPTSDEIESRCKERIQRSWPLPGEKKLSDNGGLTYQPGRAAPYFSEKRRRNGIPPARESQHDNTVRPRQGASLAPIITGTQVVAKQAEI